MRVLLPLVNIDALFETTVKVKLDRQRREILDEGHEITRRVVIVRRLCHARLRAPRRSSARWCPGRL
jgi:hypothetical protein